MKDVLDDGCFKVVFVVLGQFDRHLDTIEVTKEDLRDLIDTAKEHKTTKYHHNIIIN